MTRQTLSSYIKRADSETLDGIFHSVIAEINRRKAATQNVDVGFWNSDGVYIEDIQKVTPEDFLPVDCEDIVETCIDRDFAIWLDSKGEAALEASQNERFVEKIQEVASDFGFDFFFMSTLRGFKQKLDQLEEDGFFEEEKEVE